MLTQEPVETREMPASSRRPRMVVALVVGLVVVVAAAIGVWALIRDRGPVAAEDARIELTLTGDGASYAGDREIVGDADVTFVNESDRPAYMIVQWFAPGSALLDEELADAPEGGDFLPGDKAPLGESVIMEEYDPGTVTLPIRLETGTYIVEAAIAGETEPTHVWRPAVVEVVD